MRTAEEKNAHLFAVLISCRIVCFAILTSARWSSSYVLDCQLIIEIYKSILTMAILPLWNKLQPVLTLSLLHVSLSSLRGSFTQNWKHFFVAKSYSDSFFSLSSRQFNSKHNPTDPLFWFSGSWSLHMSVLLWFNTCNYAGIFSLEGAEECRVCDYDTQNSLHHMLVIGCLYSLISFVHDYADWLL